MDLQPWMPLFALLGGAVGAAVINGFFGFKKQKSDRNEEHARWLRDKKQESYVEFFETSRVVLNLVYHTESEKNRSRLTDAADVVKGSPIRLLAPREIVDLFDKAQEGMGKCLAVALDEDISPEARAAKLDGLRGDVEGTRIDLAAMCRADLIESEQAVKELMRKPPTQVVRVSLRTLDFPTPQRDPKSDESE
ncbi:hypothetical protein J7E83_02290 [Arthrobacter sp. ISL-48]|uniref:hypothetical protein n=1 Tax=Arthrobacter sp. ISL-48 TaxID=2819110 RepID=UPI001BE84F3F|nr:hypothetical protein [Arthrobacter sp. ISL-48]MBT2530967.1 hypothetical protein [Arthrobacter sp. ISL-48]